MEESKLFLNPYDNVVRVVILIIGINKIIALPLGHAPFMFLFKHEYTLILVSGVRQFQPSIYGRKKLLLRFDTCRSGIKLNSLIITYN